MLLSDLSNFKARGVLTAEEYFSEKGTPSFICMWIWTGSFLVSNSGIHYSI